MAVTQQLSTDALTVKIWSDETWIQAIQQSVLSRMFNSDAIYVVDKLNGKNVYGDAITFPYIGKLTGNPTGEGGTMDGNEEALDKSGFQMAMNVTRHAVLNPNDETIEQQRTTINFENTTKKLMANRFREYFDTSALYQLAGANPNSIFINGTTYDTTARKLHVQGHNVPVAPSAGRIIRPAGAANDQSITSAGTMTLSLIDFAMEQAANSEQPIEPLSDGSFDLYISPSNYTDLRQDTTSAIQWGEIMLAQETAGQDAYGKSLYLSGAKSVGRYGNVNIIVSPRVATGVNSATGSAITTVRRAVLVGSNALSFGATIGGRPSDTNTPFNYYTQLKDYGYYKGIEGRAIYGLRKMAPGFGREDIGVTVISTYAGPHY